MTENPRIGLLWRGDPTAQTPSPSETRFRRIFEEFAKRGALAQPVVYAEEVHDRVREQLLGMNGVLVWVDPIVNGRERDALDEMLREVSNAGVLVSAHPDTIAKMGTKEVLCQTRGMAWGTDATVYRNTSELTAGLKQSLNTSGRTVLKQNRGSSGNGVWRIELVSNRSALDDFVRVQPAQRGATVEDMPLSQFVDSRAPFFDSFGGTGCFVDQPYAERLGEGMVRCYMTQNRVVGFGHQLVTALIAPALGESCAPDPQPRLYYGADKPEFQRLKVLLESAWIDEMQRLLGIDEASLPMIWDADFLLGPKDAGGNDSYLLCEINVSGVFPIPDEAMAPLVEAVLAKIRVKLH